MVLPDRTDNGSARTYYIYPKTPDYKRQDLDDGGHILL